MSEDQMIVLCNHQKFNDLSEKRFGRLIPVRFLGKPQARWEFLCECGKSCILPSRRVVSGNTRSCGCAAKANRKTHGMAGTPEYNLWIHIRDRCGNPKNKKYSDYGGRGISVCDEWKNSFESFLSYVGMKPGRGYSLDRKDNDGNYEPGNVRWVTAFTQNNNTRQNRMVKFRGKTMNVSEWSREIGINYDCLFARLRKGWSVKRALTTLVRTGCRNLQ